MVDAICFSCGSYCEGVELDMNELVKKVEEALNARHLKDEWYGKGNEWLRQLVDELKASERRFELLFENNREQIKALETQIDNLQAALEEIEDKSVETHTIFTASEALKAISKE